MKITLELPRVLPAQAAAIADVIAKLPVAEIRFDPWNEMNVAMELIEGGMPPDKVIEVKHLGENRRAESQELRARS